MKKSIGFVLSLVLISTLSFGQEDEFNDNFFMSMHSSFYFDYIWTPLKVEYAPTGNVSPDPTPDDPNNVKIDYADIPFQSFTNNLISIGLEPRYNIRTLDENSAIAISSPISIGFGQVTAPPYSDFSVGSIEGFGSIQIPLFAKLYIGSGSTYESEKDFGISFGAGLEFNKVGLIRLDQSQSAYRGNTAFVIPVASLGFHFWRGYSPVEVNIKYGETQSRTFAFDRNGQSIHDATNGKQTNAEGKGRVIRISMSQILNY
ncbi:MAG: hypothetical protein ACI9UJ_001126 [bacterium]|jgi:hypothetical protein